jgi:hypothetical protein
MKMEGVDRIKAVEQCQSWREEGREGGKPRRETTKEVKRREVEHHSWFDETTFRHHNDR